MYKKCDVTIMILPYSQRISANRLTGKEEQRDDKKKNPQLVQITGSNFS